MWPYLLVSISGVAKRTSSQSAEIQEFGSEEKHNIIIVMPVIACYSVAGMLAS